MGFYRKKPYFPNSAILVIIRIKGQHGKQNEGETEILTDLKKSENLALMPSNIKFIDDEEGTLDKLSNNKILYDLTKEKNA